MPALGLGFQGEVVEEEARRKEGRQLRSGGRRRRRRGDDGSPGTLIYYSSDHHSCSGDGAFGDAGGSLFSSGARSAGNPCSFGSDHEAVFSILQPLAGREAAGAGRPAHPDLEGRSSPPHHSLGILNPSPCHSLQPPNPSKVPAEDLEQREPEEVEEEEGKEEDDVVVEKQESLKPSKHSLSNAFRECQSRRCRSEAVTLPSRKPCRRRPVSLDFNGQTTDLSVLSPRFFVGGVPGMKKSSATSSRSRSGTFPSPGTPNYRHGTGAAAYQKGWSSERVPLPAHNNRRYGGSGMLLPFANGRALPSKWEDAERWIFSPVSGDGVGRSPMPPSHHRRPKSKSGPLGAPAGISGTYSLASPLVPCFDSGRVGNFAANSPFLAGVLMPERGFYCNGSGGRRVDGGEGGGGGIVGVGGGSAMGGNNSGNGEPYMVRSASIHGWSDTLIESSSSVPSSQDEKIDGTIEAASTVSTSILRKDVATQMSPEGSTPSSPKEGPFSPSPVSVPPIEEVESHFSKIEIRDVEVDDRVTMTRWSKKHIARDSDRHPTSIIEWKKKTVEANTDAWVVAETARSISKHKREEAKITAWENLQRAKADAEIRKLEMKLEKKRSSSMEKIINKLRLAQKKAQEMRNVVTASQVNQVPKTAGKCLYFRKRGQISSLSGCFTCHAF
ncbi:unnamed protein product [Musa textilis]